MITWLYKLQTQITWWGWLPGGRGSYGGGLANTIWQAANCTRQHCAFAFSSGQQGKCLFRSQRRPSSCHWDVFKRVNKVGCVSSASQKGWLGRVIRWQLWRDRIFSLYWENHCVTYWKISLTFLFFTFFYYKYSGFFSGSKVPEHYWMGSVGLLMWAGSRLWWLRRPCEELYGLISLPGSCLGPALITQLLLQGGTHTHRHTDTHTHTHTHTHTDRQICWFQGGKASAVTAVFHVLACNCLLDRVSQVIKTIEQCPQVTFERETCF